jgi:hypothetical protein
MSASQSPAFSTEAVAWLFVSRDDRDGNGVASGVPRSARQRQFDCRIAAVRQDGSAKAIGRVAKRALLLLVALSPAAGLTACGGGGTSASTAASSVASAPAATSTATSTPTHTATAAQPPAKAPHQAPPSASGGSSSGGGGASFREPHADNSIPDFGAEASTGELARATAALAAFLHARAGGEWAAACVYLAGPTRVQLERFGGAAKGGSKGCGTALAALSGGGGHGASPSRAETLTGSVAALRVKGNSAFALYRGPNGNKYVMPMVKEGGAWKIGQLAPIAYPIGTTGAAP